MTTEPTDGGPAFPVPPNEERQKEEGWERYPTGLSVRDYFAAHAMEGDIYHYQEFSQEPIQGTLLSNAVAKYSREQARWRFADAMLAARKGGAQ